MGELGVLSIIWDQTSVVGEEGCEEQWKSILHKALGTQEALIGSFIHQRIVSMDANVSFPIQGYCQSTMDQAVPT